MAWVISGIRWEGGLCSPKPWLSVREQALLLCRAGA